MVALGKLTPTQTAAFASFSDSPGAVRVLDGDGFFVHHAWAQLTAASSHALDALRLPLTENPRSRAWRKKQLERIVRRIRDNAVGRPGYSAGDFVEDVKRACAREAVLFNNDIFNELAG